MDFKIDIVLKFLFLTLVVSCNSEKDAYVEKIIKYNQNDFYLPLQVEYNDSLYIGILTTNEIKSFLPFYINYIPELKKRRIFNLKQWNRNINFTKEDYLNFKNCLLNSNTKIMDTVLIFKNYCFVSHYDKSVFIIPDTINESIKKQTIYSLVKNNYSCLIDCESGVTLVSKIK